MAYKKWEPPSLGNQSGTVLDVADEQHAIRERNAERMRNRRLRQMGMLPERNGPVEATHPAAARAGDRLQVVQAQPPGQKKAILARGGVCCPHCDLAFFPEEQPEEPVPAEPSVERAAAKALVEPEPEPEEPSGPEPIQLPKPRDPGAEYEPEEKFAIATVALDNRKNAEVLIELCHEYGIQRELLDLWMAKLEKKRAEAELTV